MNFDEACAKKSFFRVTDKDDRLNYTPTGGVTLRHGYARLEVTGQYLVDRDYVVSYYLPSSQLAQATISAIVVDFGHRGANIGHEALMSFLDMADNDLQWDEIYLEAIQLKQRGIGKSCMDDLALHYWYRRHGFRPRPRYTRDGGIDGDSTRVMMRRRFGALS